LKKLTYVNILFAQETDFVMKEYASVLMVLLGQIVWFSVLMIAQERDIVLKANVCAISGFLGRIAL
jgi:hypothetical protein